MFFHIVKLFWFAFCFVGLFHVAFAVADEENDSNWLWFQRFLRVALNSNRLLSFISDRHHGILQGVKYVFPYCYHSFCRLHLQGNLKKFKGVSSTYRDSVVNEFVACRYKCSKESYN